MLLESHWSWINQPTNPGGFQSCLAKYSKYKLLKKQLIFEPFIRFLKTADITVHAKHDLIFKANPQKTGFEDHFAHIF